MIFDFLIKYKYVTKIDISMNHEITTIKPLALLKQIIACSNSNINDGGLLNLNL